MSKRRARGEGGLYQRPDGQWCGTLSLGIDGSGKRIRRKVYGATRPEAAKKLQEARDEAKSGVLKPSRDTVSQFLSQWMGLRKIEDTTRESNLRTVQNHIEPYLGAVALGSLTPMAVETWLRKLEDEHVGPAARQKAFILLRTALKKAMAWKLLSHNPTDNIDRPDYESSEMHVWTSDEARRFLEAARRHVLYPVYHLALTTGMRVGELQALRWENVDLKNRVIHVKESLASKKNKDGERYTGTYAKAPKTRAGLRSISIDDRDVEVLIRHREKLLARGLAACPLVFCTKRGKHVRRTHIARVMDKYVEKAGVTRLHVHELRHTNATLLIASGMDVRTVSGRLGHASPTITLNVYAKFFKPADEKAAQVMGDLLAP